MYLSSAIFRLFYLGSRSSLAVAAVGVAAVRGVRVAEWDSSRGQVAVSLDARPSL